MQTRNQVPESFLTIIQGIAKTLKPVKPIRLLPLFLKWGAISVIPIIMTVFDHHRPDLSAQLHETTFYVPILFLGLGLVLGMFGVLASGFPGERRLTSQTLTLSSVVIGMLLLLYFLPLGKDLAQTHHIVALDDGRACSYKVLELSLIPLLSGIFFLKKLCPTRRRQSGLFLFAMSTVIGSLGLHFLCPSANSAHILVWHFFPVFGTSLLGAWVGLRLLKW